MSSSEHSSQWWNRHFSKRDLAAGADNEEVSEHEYAQLPSDDDADVTDEMYPVGDTADDLYTDTMVDEDALADMQAFKSLDERRKKEKHRKKVRLIIILSIAGALILACVIVGIVMSRAMSTQTVATTNIERGTFTDTVTGSSTLAPVSSTNVTPEVDGIIDAVYVSEGSTVNAGDILFTLKNDSLDQSITQANDQVKSAQNGVNAAQVSLDNAYAALTSYQNSYNEQVDAYNASLSSSPIAGSVTKPSYDDSTYVGAINSAQVSLDGAYITLSSANDTYDQAVEKAAKRTVSAPCSGSIVSMNAVAGTAVSSGMSTGSTGSSATASSPLIQIADSSQMTVTIQVNEVDITKIAVGQTAKVSFPAVSDLTLDATVVSIATVSTASTTTTASGSSNVVTYAVKLLIATPDARLKPGMTAAVTITTAVYDDVFMVPVAAVQTAEDGSRYIIKSTTDDKGNTTTENQPVTVKTQSSTTAVVEGADLEEGETIQLSAADTSTSTSSSSAATTAG